MHRELGCGWDGFEGAATFAYDRYPDVKTCPQYLACSPFVQSIWLYLTPYRNGGLGNVMDLPNQLFEYLSILDEEVTAHQAWVDEKLMTRDG